MDNHGKPMIKGMKLNLSTVLLCSTLLAGCFFDKQLSEEEVKTVEALKSELSRIESDLSALEQDQSLGKGGLIGTLKNQRLEVLKLNKELFVQRIASIEAGADFTIKPIASAVDQTLVDSIDEDLNIAADKLKNAKDEAAHYSAGLLFALKQANVATQENAITMLEYRKSLAKYGLYINDLGTNVKSSDTTSTEAEHSAISLVPASDGPFGLSMGIPEEAFGTTLTKVVTGKFFVDSVPSPHEDFEQYVLEFGKNSGLCWIKAISKDIPTDSMGYFLKSKFNELEKVLSNKYGKGAKTDLLLPGSIWNDPKDWMNGLAKNERYFITIWDSKDGLKLPNDISLLAITADAEDTKTGTIALEYTFTNGKACEAENRALKNESL
jgi:outer membrane murein-binding lipoprotein Lpp